MVAETEDLMFEYCMTTEKMRNVCVIEGGKESPYGRMRKPGPTTLTGLKTMDIQKLFENPENNY